MTRALWLPALWLALPACGTDDADPADDATAASATDSTVSGSASDPDGGPGPSTAQDGASDPTAPTGATDPTDPTDPTTAGPTTTDPTAADSSGSDSQGEMGGGTIDVTLTGCSLDFGGTVVVSYNGSLGVASVYDNFATLSASFQFDLDGPGTMMLSSQHRVDTGNVVNMVDLGLGTWTNLDSDALAGGGVDSISGTLTVSTWNPAAGESSLQFDAVTLRNVVDGNVCTIDGSIETTELYP